jgi:hypothetical protein
MRDVAVACTCEPDGLDPAKQLRDMTEVARRPDDRGSNLRDLRDLDR